MQSHLEIGKWTKFFRGHLQPCHFILEFRSIESQSKVLTEATMLFFFLINKDL